MPVQRSEGRDRLLGILARRSSSLLTRRLSSSPRSEPWHLDQGRELHQAPVVELAGDEHLSSAADARVCLRLATHVCDPVAPDRGDGGGGDLRVSILGRSSWVSAAHPGRFKGLPGPRRPPWPGTYPQKPSHHSKHGASLRG